jgi:hypothetical protein
MSSESTSYYTVLRNAEIEAAARQAALAAIQQCSREFDELRLAAAAFASRNEDTGVTISLPAAPVATSEGTSTRAGAEAHLADWRRTIAEARRVIVSGHGRAASRRFLQALGGGSGPRTARDVVGEMSAQAPAADMSRWLADVERILADARVAPADMEKLLEDAASLRESVQAGRGGGPALESFRQRVAVATAAYVAREREVADAAELQASLAGLTGEDVDATCRQLLEVQSGQRRLTPQLRDRTAEVARRAKAAADDRWVARLVEQELVRLGYQVESGFSTETGEVTHLQAHRRDWVERDGTVAHDILLAFDTHAGVTEDGAIEITVRHAPDESLTGARRNLAVEQRWCADFPSLLHRLKQSEVDMWLQRANLKPAQAAPAVGRRVLARDSSGTRRPVATARINRREGT